MLLCYNYQNGITYEEEDIMFTIEPKLLSVGAINLLEIIWSIKTIDAEIMDISAKTSSLELKLTIHIIKQKIINNRDEP
jgi:hypothetical protein